MSRSVSIALAFGGGLLALGMLFIPFTAVADQGTAIATEAPTTYECGALLARFVADRDPEDEIGADACDRRARDRTMMVIAGGFAAVLGRAAVRNPD